MKRIKLRKSFSTIPVYCEHSIINWKFWPIFGEGSGLRPSVTENDRFDRVRS